MLGVENNDGNSIKNKPNDSSKPVIIDFGTRAISDQNFSKVVALPKVALQNLGDITHLNVQLVQQDGEKYLKLSPVQDQKEVKQTEHR